MLPFDFQCPTRIIFGPGKLNALGSLARSIDAKRALVVSDRGIVAAGHTPRGIQSLEHNGIAVALFDRIDENPTTANVDDGLAMAKEVRPDLIIGIGGGSSMDCAKGINFLYSCGGRMQDYWGDGKATGPLLPMIAVPTTAGTGSETQSYALITDAATHVKMACGDKRAAFRAAILDPELTLTQPKRVTALTGIDALAHALETYVTKRRNPLSLVFSREAWRHLAPNMSRVINEPTNLPARAAMQLGACLAGLAIENSMLGAAHALANPLTANYGIAHGEAIAVMLPHAIRRNRQQVEAWYRELIDCADGVKLEKNDRTAAEAVAKFVAELAHIGGLNGKLSDCRVPHDHLSKLAEEAKQQWTARFNPIELTKTDFLELYEAAF
ncbi:MAG TPA: iron-containing alcohol dehydrogenase [Lacipirellulaceae bacterium]|nr:iron-containing alcohol dehydrogenase [Lacipirellulaceae bacterium]